MMNYSLLGETHSRVRENVTTGRDRQGEPGRLSYLMPDRTKPITAWKLGDDFDRAAVLVLLTIYSDFK